MRVLVIVPTTGGPLVVRSLKVRAGLPASAAFADGDYRPLPWSADYARLVGPEGPLAHVAAADRPAPGAYELRLSGSFDAGRSWEAPVALAHLLIDRGHSLTDAPDQADLILWATGALDLDLRVIPGDYALLDKIESSRALLGEAPTTGLAVLLPAGADAAAAQGLLGEQEQARPLHVLPSASLVAAAVRLDELARREQGQPPPEPARAARRVVRWPLAAGLAAAVVAVAGTALMVRSTLSPTSTAPPPDAPGQGGRVAVARPSPTPAPPEPPPVTVSEVRAPAGRTCRQLLFAAGTPEQRPVPLEGGSFAATRLDPALCGLAISVRDPQAMSVEVSPALVAVALPISRQRDGSQLVFLRDHVRQNVVYSLQVFAGDGATRRPLGSFTHQLVP